MKSLGPVKIEGGEETHLDSLLFWDISSPETLTRNFFGSATKKKKSK